jgi:hypothetical protein
MHLDREIKQLDHRTTYFVWLSSYKGLGHGSLGQVYFVDAGRNRTNASASPIDETSIE